MRNFKRIPINNVIILKATSIAKKYKLNDDLHRCHYSFALFYKSRKNPNKAKREIERAEKVACKLKDGVLISNDLWLKAVLFVTLGDYNSARQCLIKACRQQTPMAQDRQKIETDLQSGESSYFNLKRPSFNIICYPSFQ